MTAEHMQGLEKFESGLWKIADDLRANSNLASNEYFMPIIGLIFLHHATNRFYEAKSAIEADKKAGKVPDCPLVEADFARCGALNLTKGSRFDVILKSPKDGNLGAALTAANGGDRSGLSAASGPATEGLRALRARSQPLSLIDRIKHNLHTARYAIELSSLPWNSRPVFAGITVQVSWNTQMVLREMWHACYMTRGATAEHR